MPSTRIWLIPVLLNNTEMPRPLRKFNAVLLFESWDAGIKEILRAMNLHRPEYRRAIHLINLIRYHPAEREHALAQLVRMDNIPADAISALLQTLRESESDYVHTLAAAVFGKITGSAAAAVSALSEALSDVLARVRSSAAVALGEIGPAAAPAVSALAGALSDVDTKVRSSAAVALAKIGPPAAEAVPALVNALHDDARVAVAAALALCQIGQPAVAALMEALGDASPRVRGCAAGALGTIGPAAAEAVPALISALHDDAPISVFVAQTVEINWSWGKEDVPELIEALCHNPDVAASAALALWRIGQPAVAALREALSSREVGKHAQIVLTGIESAAGRTGQQPTIGPLPIVPGPAGSTQYLAFPDGSKIELPEHRQRKP